MLKQSFDAQSNVIDSLHYILSIVDILDSCVAYINSSTSKEIISQDNLKRYKSTILEFFNVIPISKHQLMFHKVPKMELLLLGVLFMVC